MRGALRNLLLILARAAALVAPADYSFYCTPPDAAFCDARDAPAAPAGPTSPGTVLMGGGTDVDAAFAWQIARAGGGDFLVLRESGTDAYNEYIFELGLTRPCGAPAALASAATLILNSRRAAADPFVLAKVAAAEAIFFAGGDQSKYVERIAGTPLQALLIAKQANVTLGGTSAGNAIEGRFVYTGARGSAVSAEVLADPYGAPGMAAGSLVGALLASPPLLAARVVMDDHFVTRDRMGRMMAFVARVVADGLAGAPVARGIGVDERSALLVEPDGAARLVGDGTAYMCDSSAVAEATCARGQPLTLSDIRCERLQAAGFEDCDDPAADTFDMSAWRGSGVRYAYNITDGVIVGQPYGP